VTGILSSEPSRLGEAVLLRWLEAHSPLSEAQVYAVTKVKQELLVGFDPSDQVVGYRWFAQRFRELANAALAKLSGVDTEVA
jgi:hypothetical protein